MPRTVSASEAKRKFGEISDWATDAQDDVIVESHGQPKVVIISFEEYQHVLDRRERARREAALEELKAIRARVRARNQDLTTEQAFALSDELVREAVQRLDEKQSTNEMVS